ncbi:MAG: type II toxin-antitoxin system PemK/MazF family toxin [Spirochaetaceae bacterium]|nr:type II toxin-antitoxin system PemK/MazF family toxin [Spirochaetaceae bacterium]
MIRGEIWWVDFGIPFGSEPGLRRPSLIVQSDSFNHSSMHTTVVIPMTSNLRLADFPGNLLLPTEATGLPDDSVAVTPQITVIDKARLLEKVSEISQDLMQQCNDCIRLLLGI